MTILVFILILALLVLSHEFGHFIVAKKTGMEVEEFGFGFPPRIFGFKKGETLYSINALPLGGFVKIKGEEGGFADEPGSFSSKPAHTRILVLIAGIVFNFILGYLLFVWLAFYDAAWYAVFGRAFEYMGMAIYLTIKAFYDVFKIAMAGGSISGFIAGPVGIISIVGDTIRAGLPYLIQLTAFLSVNLAIINILPVPALDGGRIFFILIETITRQKINPKISAIAHTLGFAALLLLLVIVTIYDVGRIFN